MRPLLALTAALLTLTGTLTSQALAQEIPAQSVTVQGTGEVEAAPDRALLSFTLQHENRELATAKEANNQAVAKILGIVKPFKLPADQIQTSGLQVYPQYDYTDNRQQFRAYQVSRSLQLTVDNLSTVEKLVDALVKGGVEHINNLHFTLKDTRALEQQALAKATANARQKAETLARSLGAKLGPVDAITEGGIALPAPSPMPMLKTMRAEAMMADAGGAPAPMLGKQTVSAHVTVRFRLN